MMLFCNTCHVLDDLEKWGQGQIDHIKFQSAISQWLFKIQTCGSAHREMMSMGLTWHISGDLQKLGQGQIDLQKFQSAISH